MSPMQHGRPRVSRETRLLLAIVALSVATLWSLARVRFPDRPATPNPVPPVLAQLRSVSPLDAIAASVADASPGIRAAVVVVDLDGAPHAALAFEEFVLTIADRPARARIDGSSASIVARDRASGLTVIRRAAAARQAPAASRVSPQFMIAVDAVNGGLVLRPEFVAVSGAAANSVWETAVYPIAAGGNLAEGTLLFTFDARLAGVVVDTGGGRAVVPSDALLVAAKALVGTADVAAGTLGLQVEALTPPLRIALGSAGGVVVSWVAPGGPAADLVRATDVVERFDDAPMTDIEDWNARAGRLNAGQEVRLTVRRGGAPLPVIVVASPIDAESALPRRLGATLRTVPGVGVQVLAVDPGTTAARAGLEPGDRITVFGGVAAPTTAEVSRIFAGHEGAALVAAVTRGDTHFVVAMDRVW